MKMIFQPGDAKVFVKKISNEDLVYFHGELLHPVYATFSLARDFEWSSRLFFIEMKEDDEEGVGTMLHIDHRSPAFAGEEVTIRAVVEKIEGMELICSIEARVGSRLIASGKTGQRMLKKDRLLKIFEKK